MAYGTDDPEIIRIIKDPDPVVIVQTTFELFNAVVDFCATLNSDFVKIAGVGFLVLIVLIIIRRTFKKIRLDGYSKSIQKKYL